MIKLLIADDHLIIRQGLRLILETENDFELIGEASDGNEALSLCKKLKPDGTDGLACSTWTVDRHRKLASNNRTSPLSS
jgi:hypothetical protein